MGIWQVVVLRWWFPFRLVLCLPCIAIHRNRTRNRHPYIRTLQIIKSWQEDIGYELSDQQLASINQTNPIKMSYSGDDGEGHVGDLLVLPSYEKIKSELKSLAISLLIQNIILNVIAVS